MAKLTEYWLTTTDNPFDPFTQFDDWYHFDEFEKRYATTGLIARFNTSPFDAPDPIIQESNKRAVEIIMKEIPLLSDNAQYLPVMREIDYED